MTDLTHGLSVQHADALWDAVAIPGPTEPTFPMQHERVCAAVAEILDEVTPAPADPQTDLRDRIAAERSERYAMAIHDAMEPDLSLVDQEPGAQALFARAAEAATALADSEQVELRRKLVAAERIRENADFHLGQEMARRQLAEKGAEAHRLALSEALGLGTGAPWDAIHDRATELGLPPLAEDPVAQRLGLAPEPADRAAVLREAADHLAAMDPVEAALAGQYAFHDAAAQLHRRANEAEFVATPCDSMVPCEDGGEPCHVHERLMSHHDGSHELCEPDCGNATPVAAVLPPPADRAAVYAEVADRLAADAEQGDKEGFTRIYRRSAAKQVREWGEKLRRLAAEAQQPETGTPASTAPLAAGLPLVQGDCPACHSSSLFLGNGGYVTCARRDCPEPDAATTALEQPAVADTGEETEA